MFSALQDIMRIDSEIQEIKDDIEQSSAEVEEATHAVAQFDTLIPPVEAEVAELQQQLSNVRLLAHCLVVDVTTGCRALGTARWASWVCVAGVLSESAYLIAMPRFSCSCSLVCVPRTQLDPESAARRLREQTSALKGMERSLAAEMSLLYV
jgi:hypothetical protein